MGTKNNLRVVVAGFHLNGSTVSLNDQRNGYLEVVSKQRDCAPRCVGLFPKERLVEALNVYHRHVDIMRMVATGRPHAS